MNSILRIVRFLVLTLVLSLLVSCNSTVQGDATASPTSTPSASKPSIAQATISDPSGKSQLNGKVNFTETAKGVLIQASVKNVPPGPHGFHIHEKGNCGDAGNAAGGHFNPDKVKHGKLITDGFANAHAGDLGNLSIAPNGTGTFAQTVPGLALNNGKYAIANHAIILHAKKDDFSQPTGNAGGRIGCGVISLAGGA